MTFPLLSRGPMIFKFLSTPLRSTDLYYGCSTEVRVQVMSARINMSMYPSKYGYVCSQE